MFKAVSLQVRLIIAVSQTCSDCYGRSGSLEGFQRDIDQRSHKDTGKTIGFKSLNGVWPIFRYCSSGRKIQVCQVISMLKVRAPRRC